MRLPNLAMRHPEGLIVSVTNLRPKRIPRQMLSRHHLGEARQAAADRARAIEASEIVSIQANPDPRCRLMLVEIQDAVSAPTHAPRRARRQAAARRPWPASSHPHAGQLLASAGDTTWECHAACASSEPGHRSKSCQSACGILRCSAASLSDGQGISLPERGDARAPRARCKHATPRADSAPRAGLSLHRSKQ